MIRVTEPIHCPCGGLNISPKAGTTVEISDTLRCNLCTRTIQAIIAANTPRPHKRTAPPSFLDFNPGGFLDI